MTTELLIALTIWLEARGEPLEGKVAVAAVIMERVKDDRWPDTVEGVIRQPKQFSCWNDKTPAEVSPPSSYSEAWAQCITAARAAISGNIPDKLRGLNHFYNPAFCKPEWAENPVRKVRIGRHIFLEK